MTAVGFQWTVRRELARILVAEDKLTGQQIADRPGVSRGALARRKANPEFAARVGSIIRSTRRAIIKRESSSARKDAAAEAGQGSRRPLAPRTAPHRRSISPPVRPVHAERLRSSKW